MSSLALSANVDVWLCVCLDASLVLQLKALAEETGLEIVILGIGHVKSGAQYSSMTHLHHRTSGGKPFVMPLQTVEDHRLVLISHSTGGPVRRAMEQPCAIAGVNADSVPSNVRMVRAAYQSLLTLAHKVRNTPHGDGVLGRWHAEHIQACLWLPRPQHAPPKQLRQAGSVFSLACQPWTWLTDSKQHSHALPLLLDTLAVIQRRFAEADAWRCRLLTGRRGP